MKKIILLIMSVIVMSCTDGYVDETKIEKDMALQTTGISISAVKTALGASSNKLSDLCKHPNINKWSKYKPISLPYITTDGITDWYLGSDGKCGMTIPVYTYEGAITAPGTFLYDLKNHSVNWTYNPPTGGVLSPYRLGDFRGYNQDAIHPISVDESASIFLNSPGDWFRLFVGMEITPGNSSNLSLEDIEHNSIPMSDFYLGVMLHKYDNYYAATASYTLGQGDYYVQFDNMSGAIGDWTASYFLLSYSKGKNDSWQSGVYIPLDVPQTDVVLYGAGTQIYVNPYGNWTSQSYDTINYTVQLINNTGSSINVTNVQSFLVYTTGSDLPENGTVVDTEDWGDYTVPGNDIDNITGGIFFHQRVANRTYWIGAKADGYATHYNEIEDPWA